jgi:hypothetical protein
MHGTEQLPVLGSEQLQIHSPRNVIRLHKDIERAFDKREVTFVEEDTGGYTLKVLCPTIKNFTLNGTSTIFGDIDACRLEMPEGGFPYRRFLAHHSFLSHRFARKEGWSKEDLSEIGVNADALMAYSLDKDALERVGYLWRSAS